MKRLKYLLIIIGTLVFAVNVNAASGSIVVSSSSKTVAVGSTFTVNVKVSCSEASAWKFGVSYDSAYISLQSGDVSPAFEGDGSTKSTTYTYKFKAIKAGSAGIRISGTDFADWNTVSSFTPSVTNATITVKTQAEIQASYSKDNNLKSLSVKGYEITPAFSKDTLEYSVEVGDEVQTISVSASPNDSTASVSGVGEIDVSEGNNKIEIVVTAQNGSVKKYTINVNVKELNPINVTIDGKNYTVVKKQDLLENPTGYISTTIKMNEIEIPAFISELTNFTLVGLKNDSGDVGLYIYNEKDNSYTKYNEIKSNVLTLYPRITDEVPEGFEKTKITINDVEYDALKKGDIVLIYAMNVETGKEGFYQYDKDENTFMKYNVQTYTTEYNNNKDFKLYLIALSCVSFILLIICIIFAQKNKKIKKILYDKVKGNNKVRNLEE